VTFVAVDGAKGLPDTGQAAYLSGGVVAGQRMLALPGDAGNLLKKVFNRKIKS